MDFLRLCHENLINVHIDKLPVGSVLLILRAFWFWDDWVRSIESLSEMFLDVQYRLMIAIERKHAIIERKNYNVSKKDERVVPGCPPDKEKAIEEALEWFGMV